MDRERCLAVILHAARRDREYVSRRTAQWTLAVDTLTSRMDRCNPAVAVRAAIRTPAVTLPPAETGRSRTCEGRKGNAERSGSPFLRALVWLHFTVSICSPGGFPNILLRLISDPKSLMGTWDPKSTEAGCSGTRPANSSPFVPVSSRHFVSSRLSRAIDFRGDFHILTAVPVIPGGTMTFCDAPGTFFDFASRSCPLLAGFKPVFDGPEACLRVRTTASWYFTPGPKLLNS